MIVTSVSTCGLQRQSNKSNNTNADFPARIIFSRTSSDDDEGPIVHTIFVFQDVGCWDWVANLRWTTVSFVNILEEANVNCRRALAPTSLVPTRSMFGFVVES